MPGLHLALSPSWKDISWQEGAVVVAPHSLLSPEVPDPAEVPGWPSFLGEGAPLLDPGCPGFTALLRTLPCFSRSMW